MTSWAKTLVISALAVFAPIQGIIITVGILIIMDLIFGIWAAIKRGEAITSAAMRRTVSKMFAYQGLVLTGFLVETYLLSGIIPVTKLVAGIIGVVELKSLVESAEDITGINFNKLIKLLGSDNDK